ncbi:RNA methyltransferase [Vallitalea longa]|uniref:RNA methyltransferase n=1 Tax=Vallitalea longa TaxID=2936439 RepID=A0A9W5Y9A0_9FIRM|nr:RNA methyltransferase [Vallitalea longa]GKX28385.1 RNA methyltransferase [Vallitalea longa]
MITSIQNPKIKAVVQLLNKAKTRKKEASFIVEGKKTINEIDVSRIHEIFMTETFFEKEQNLVKGFIEKKVKIEIVNDSVMKHISNSVTPQGILGIIRIVPMKLNIMINSNPLIIILENIQDPGNLGTIIRTCDAVKASGVIISKGSVDLYNPKVVRATMGSIFRVPVITDSDLIEDIKILKSNNIEIIASHLQGSDNLYKCNLTRGIGVLIGNEGNGLTDEVVGLANRNIKIPMIGKSESLNAGVATSIIAYEALRQRKYM